MRALLLPLALLAYAALWMSPAVAITPVRSTPVVTLSEMAKSPVRLKAGDFALDRVFHSATETFPFVLPTGSVPSTPGESWFLLDLSYTIEFGADSAEGFAWVSADTNGLTSAQAEYALTRVAGELAVSESTVTLLDGQEERQLEGLSADVDYVNYARDEGVVEGRNSFTVRVEHTEGVVIEQIEFHDDSGVSRTTVSPDPFQLGATVEHDEIHVGEEFEVLVRATNTSKAELGEVSIEAVLSDGFARLLVPATRQLGPLAEPTQHVYRFEALRAGTGQVAILGSSARNEPSAIVDLTVLAPERSRTETVALVALAGALPLALVTGLLLLRARRRP